jgi:hypothetical protein
MMIIAAVVLLAVGWIGCLIYASLVVASRFDAAEDENP